MRSARWWGWGIILLVAAAASIGQARPAPAQLRLLVLGDDSDRVHQPYENTRFLIDALQTDGTIAEARYTESLNDLTAENLADFDAVLSYTWRSTQRGDELPNDAEREGLASFVRQGGALVVVHSGLASFDDWPEYGEMIGARWVEGQSNYSLYAPVYVNPHQPRHDAVGSVGRFTMIDAPLFNLAETPGVRRRTLMHVTWQGNIAPAAWTVDYGQGRVFATILGHGPDTWQTGGFQRLVRGGLLWASRR